MRKLLPENTRQSIKANIKTSAATADNNLSHLAFDNVAQANVIIIVSSGKIIMANNAACKLLGYSKKEILTKNRADIFDIGNSAFKQMLQQRAIEGQSKALVFAINKSGKPIPCEITSAVFTGAHGIEKSITTITDVTQRLLKQRNTDAKKEKLFADNVMLVASKQKALDVKREKVVADNIVTAKSKQKSIDNKKQKIIDKNIIEALAKSDARLTENNEWIKYIAKSSYDVMWDWDIVSGQIYVGESITEVFGYRVKKNLMSFADFCKCLIEKEKDVVKERLKNTLASGSNFWDDTFMFKRYNGSVASTICRASIIRDDAGKAIRLIGALQDVSRLQELEKKLEDQIVIHVAEEEKMEHEIKLKEKQIIDATEDAKEMERSNIGKELHDNINQLLGASRMYLEMAKKGGLNSTMYLSRSSQYTLTAIEEIRKLTKGLSTDVIKNLGLSVAIDNLATDMAEVNPIKICCRLNSFSERTVTDKFKLNIFRIVQEQLNNILKHAHASKVSIDLSQNENFIQLSIADNGVGFDTDKKQNGIGIDNINSRAASYNGIASFVSQPGKGCVLKVIIPLAAK